MGSLVAELAEKLSAATNSLDFDEQTMFLNTSANTVGIGTNAPASKLDVRGTMEVGLDDTGYDVKFFGATSGNYMLWDEDADSLLINGDVDMVTNGNRIDLDTDNDTSIRASADDTITIEVGGNDLIALTTTSTFSCPVTVGVDGTGHDVQLFGDTASSVLLWDQSDDQLEFGNATMTMSDARTSGTATITGLTIDMYNKLDTGSSNDRIGAAISTYGDTNAYTIRDSVGIRAMSRQSTGAEVTRLNTPLHSVLDLANTAIANNSGTTLSGAYGLVIDHDDTIATRTGQPTAFISFGEMYVGGTESIETKYLFDIFPNGKTGDATYGTAADVAFYNDGAQYATTRDTMLLNSTDGAPATNAGDHLLMEPDPFDAILLESGTTSGGGGDDMGFITTESGESVVLEDSSQDNPTGFGNFILFETGAQDADGVLKIRVNGEDKYIQLYNVVS